MEPLCEMIATGPGVNDGKRPAVHIAVRPWTLMYPMLLGPASAMPWAFAAAWRRACSARPSGPPSAYPLALTTTARMPALPASSTRAGPFVLGTAMNAASTGSGSADREG